MSEWGGGCQATTEEVCNPMKGKLGGHLKRNRRQGVLELIDVRDVWKSGDVLQQRERVKGQSYVESAT